jgi:hypothetical protein
LEELAHSTIIARDDDLSVVFSVRVDEDHKHLRDNEAIVVLQHKTVQVELQEPLILTRTVSSVLPVDKP